MGNADQGALADAQVCLDFINTVNYRLGPHPQDGLPDYLSLLEWARKAGLIESRVDAALQRQAVEHPQPAAREFAAAIRVREALFSLLSAYIAGKAPRAADLDLFNRTLGEVLSQARIVPSPTGYTWGWHAAGKPGLEVAYWPVVHTSAGLLTSPSLLERLGQCADEQCGWLFFDTSKNHSRKWCDINDCGNRAKQRRYRGKRHSL